MAYYNEAQLASMNFKRLGKNVKISDKASVYDADRIEIGDHSRVDDFCVLSGKISIGDYCHLTPMCLVAGGEPGVTLSDFCTLAYGAKVFAQSDDYSGATMVNSQIPREYKSEIFEPVEIGRHVVVGAGSTVFPGVTVAEGCAIGAMSLVNRSTQPWGVYIGIPARRAKERKKDLLGLERKFMASQFNDSI